MKWLYIFLIITTLSGCAIGRTWDTPENESELHDIPNLNKITFYTNANGFIIKNALNEPAYTERANDFKLVEEHNKIPEESPAIKVHVGPPKYSKNILTTLTTIISGLTFSIIPGYHYKYSDVVFELILPDELGNQNTTNYKYTAKRHYLSWLPLAFSKNFVTTVQVHDEPATKWNQGYENLALQFLQDAKPTIEKYRLSSRH